MRVIMYVSCVLCDGVCFCSRAGEPFRLHYWLAQLSVYMIVMLVMKLIVGPLVAFNFWKEVHLPQPMRQP